MPWLPKLIILDKLKGHALELGWVLILHFIIIGLSMFLVAHGYGPTLLAGAEIIRMIENHSFEIYENSLQLRS